MKKADIKVGMYVTCKNAVEAYYSNYGGAPQVFFKPTMRGRVGAADVPCVNNNFSFVCVDFKSVPSNPSHPHNSLFK